MVLLAVIGGIWLSLLYSASVPPASVHVIRVTVERGAGKALLSALGMCIGQLPHATVAALLAFSFPGLSRPADPALRMVAAVFLVWMAWRTLKAEPLQRLAFREKSAGMGGFGDSFRRSLFMPHRLPFWICLLLSTGVHLRGPGPGAVPPFVLGAVLGQFAWHLHFIVVAALFGRRVPEPVSLRSLNKLRPLAGIVIGGLAFLLLAPLLFPPA